MTPRPFPVRRDMDLATDALLDALRQFDPSYAGLPCAVDGKYAPVVLQSLLAPVKPPKGLSYGTLQRKPYDYGLRHVFDRVLDNAEMTANMHHLDVKRLRRIRAGDIEQDASARQLGKRIPRVSGKRWLASLEALVYMSAPAQIEMFVATLAAR